MATREENIAVAAVLHKDWDTMEFKIIERMASLRSAHRYERVVESMSWLMGHQDHDDFILSIRGIRGCEPDFSKAWIDAALEELGIDSLVTNAERAEHENV